MSFHRLFTLVIVSCLICMVGALTYGADDSAEVDIVPGWSGGTPSGVLYDKNLDLTGADNQYFFGSYQQLGPRGFFGDANVDRSSTGLFSNLNGWVGNPGIQAIGVTTVSNGARSDIANDLVSGTGASVSSVVLSVTPRYGNDWVHLQARYTINPYQTSAFPGAATPIAQPQLTLWQAKVSTPIADIALGKNVFQRGCSLQFSSKPVRRSSLCCRSPTKFPTFWVASYAPEYCRHESCHGSIPNFGLAIARPTRRKQPKTSENPSINFMAAIPKARRAFLP